MRCSQGHAGRQAESGRIGLGAGPDHAAQVASLQIEAEQVPVEQPVGMRGEQQAIGGVETFRSIPARSSTSSLAVDCS
jgi:hypothetical protein